MKNPLTYLKNGFRVGTFKLRYDKAFNTGWIQSFNKLRLELPNGGKLMMSSYKQNQEKIYIGFDRGELKNGSRCFFYINLSITCLDGIEIGDNCVIAAGSRVKEQYSSENMIIPQNKSQFRQIWEGNSFFYNWKLNIMYTTHSFRRCLAW